MNTSWIIDYKDIVLCNPGSRMSSKVSLYSITIFFIDLQYPIFLPFFFLTYLNYKTVSWGNFGLKSHLPLFKKSHARIWTSNTSLDENHMITLEFIQRLIKKIV